MKNYLQFLWKSSVFLIHDPCAIFMMTRLMTSSLRHTYLDVDYLAAFRKMLIPKTSNLPLLPSQNERNINRLTKQFWNSWKREYLVGLREHHNCRNRIPPKQISVGEVVLIEEKLPRNRWKMGIVTEVHVGRDAHVRGCKVRTLTRNTNRVTYLNRPVNKL